MKKNSTMKLICAIVGGVVIVGAMVVTLVHFWDDLKKLCPCCKREEAEALAEEEDFEDLAE